MRATARLSAGWALTAAMGPQLEQTEVEAIGEVAKALFTMATQKNNVAAAIFRIKARAGWKEKQQLEVTGANDGPVAALQIISDDAVAASKQYLGIVSGPPC